MRNFVQQTRSPSRGTSQERDTRFGGYGDRVGSGVELAPTHWKGGELVTDPTLVNKVLYGIKPKKFFYSPIGDGVVAADGVELKRGPTDLTPKVEVIQQRVVEKGSPGQSGLRVTERAWSSGAPGAGGETLTQSAYSTKPATPTVQSPVPAAAPAPPAASTNVAASAASPVASPFGGLSDPLGFGNGPATTAAPIPNYGTASSVPSTNYNTLASRPATEPYAPYSTLGSQRSSAAPFDTFNSKPSSRAGSVLDYPASGRASRASTTADLFSEPGYRYEIKKDYQVTNPKELIHQYATTTPIQTIPGYEQETTRLVKQSYHSVTEETYGPYPPYAAGPNSVNPNKFVRQLRDENLTVTQRQANQNLQPLINEDPNLRSRIDQVRRQNQSSSNNEVDSLTQRLVTGLQTGKY
ncbi:unnamed protein product [Bursaphelenchus xylophilus]|uniref:(pine wood nematode) hypothetical protein n=1 Tax=Bursaphelenchus xylophilus TaxID=6326 RepID=A0A1I7SQD1_BURXY|nr:unnamed protein product [Bursaphelenchus xylophilus]CAG9109740.1 unnamed protein product [Bursaphelenchus xylophilus]